MGDTGMVAGRGRPVSRRNDDPVPERPRPVAVQDIEYHEFTVGPDRYLSERYPGQRFIWLWSAGHRVAWVHQNADGAWELEPFATCAGWLCDGLARRVLATTLAAWGIGAVPT